MRRTKAVFAELRRVCIPGIDRRRQRWWALRDVPGLFRPVRDSPDESVASRLDDAWSLSG